MKDIKPSPALHCKFGLSDDYIDTFISPKERLILDVSKYVKEQDMNVLPEIRDSLLVFGMLVSWPFYWKATELYDMTWKESPTQMDGETIEPNGDEQIQANNVDDWKIESIDDIISHYFKQNYISEGESANQLSKEKISHYPNIHAILDYLNGNLSIPMVRKILSALYVATDQEDKAISIYQNMKQMDAYDYYNLGTIHLIYKKDYQSAQGQFTKALELKESQYNLGIAYLRENNMSNAEGQFRQLAEPFDINDIEIKSVNGILVDHAIKQYACNNMGFYSCGFDKYKEALDWFDKAIEWSSFTGLPYGASNKQSLINIMRDLIRPEKRTEIIDNFHGIIGKSAKMQEVFDLIKKVAPTDAKVLITGKTGTGKELVENCSSVTETLEEDWLFGHDKGGFTDAKDEKPGIFEQADSGTLFLDEIGDMRLGLQTKFLRVIEDKNIKRLGSKGETKKADVRIICATNKNPEKEVEDGKLRDDLYYRINVLPIHLPPLRERREDIPLLIDHFINKFAESIPKDGLSISPNARRLLEKYDWPGNIRELENKIESSAIETNGNIINIGDLPEGICNNAGRGKSPLNLLTKEEIKEKRKALGLTQEQFAEQIGIKAQGKKYSREYINKIESGIKPVTKNISKIVTDLLSEKSS
jgi:sigma-54 specific flagellar transcriptional regulator A